MLRGLASAALVVVGALSLPAVARAQAEEELAQRYAPVVRLVEQKEECGPGEPYEPIDIDAILGQDTVSLRGPWTENDLVKIAPTGADLGKGLFEYNLDFPGDALNPGCDYERWARRITEGKQPAVYAHVATEPAYPDRLALQYWIFYPFNNWNNNHEGDWEMVQLVFAAASPDEALGKQPLEIGYSQHEGAEKSAWEDDKLERVDGTHPVVYPAAGSHANFYDDALYIGRSADEGVGCDDTTGPSRDLRPVVHTIPSDPAAARNAFPWIAYEGRWGERRRAFLNGPTGPNLKSQWTEPITWSEDWRDRSVAVPAGGALGTGATDFFCDAVATGSNVVLRLEDNPGWVIAALTALVLLLIAAVRRTTWRPTTPLAVARRRSWGQTLTAAGRMYASRPLLFLGIGLVTIPIALVVTLLQALLFSATTIAGISPDAESGGIRVGLAVAIGTVLTLLGLALVQAATSRAIAEIDGGREIGVVSSYRLSLDSIRPLLGALAVAVGVVTLLSLSIFLIPIAVWLVVRWALMVPVAELEDRHSWSSVLRRSGSLVRHQWFKVGTLVVAAAALAIVAGPLLGALLLFIPGTPVALVNIIAGLIYAVAMPFVGLTTTYVYYDTLVRERLAPATAAPARLPAEL
ncbi:MAG TPA: hypothetical protein VFG93_05070 [Gaiellaceae bacterium]|nr:hypothetical protein [Gaiellaceae bacterium]